MRAPLPVLCLLLACSDPSARPDAGAAPDAGVDAAPEPEDTGPPIPGAQTLSTTLPDMPLEAGEEDASLCFSWTLDNATEVFVNTVRMEATRGIHHSNWFFVRPNVFQGEDGLWKCRDRGFDSVAAATSGGVLFAQSTQAAARTFPCFFAQLRGQAIVRHFILLQCLRFTSTNKTFFNPQLTKHSTDGFFVTDAAHRLAK